MLSRLSSFMIDNEIESAHKSLILNISEVIAACSILNMTNASVRAANELEDTSARLTYHHSGSRKNRRPQQQIDERFLF